MSPLGIVKSACSLRNWAGTGCQVGADYRRNARRFKRHRDLVPGTASTPNFAGRWRAPEQVPPLRVIAKGRRVEFVMRATGLGALAIAATLLPSLILSSSAQEKRGGGGGGTPRISAPAPHAAPPAAPRISAPAPHIAPPAAAPRFSAPPPHHVAPAPRFAAPHSAPPRVSAPHVATPRVATPRHAAPDIARQQRGPR